MESEEVVRMHVKWEALDWVVVTLLFFLCNWLALPYFPSG